jgi:predicted kinase
MQLIVLRGPSAAGESTVAQERCPASSFVYYFDVGLAEADGDRLQ